MKDKRSPREGPAKLHAEDPARGVMSTIGLAISAGHLEAAEALLALYLADQTQTGIAHRYPLVVDELQRRLVKARARAGR